MGSCWRWSAISGEESLLAYRAGAGLRRGNLRLRIAPWAVLAALYLIPALLTLAARPTLAAPMWDGWWDQSLYWRSAQALARFDLAPSQHYYPLLYPLAGAPFAWLPQGLVFLAPNLACYLLAFDGFRRVATRLTISVWPAMALFAASTLLPIWQIELWVVPWTTTLSAALLWQALGAIDDLADRPSPARAALLGMLVVAIPFTRPGDALVGAAVGLGGLAMLARRGNWRAVGGAVTGGAAALAVCCGLYLAVYGFALSSYARLSLAYGYDFAVFGWRAQVLLNDPRGWFGEGQGLLEALPWLPVGAAGMLYLAWRAIAARSLARMMLPVAVMLYAVMMLAYTDLLPPGLWEYHGVHYFKWLFPAFALAGVAMLLAARRRPMALIPLGLVAALSLLHLAPIAVGDDAPARMLVFEAPPAATRAELYFAASLIADRAGLGRNIFDYRQASAGGSARAVALRRDFAGGERWIGNGGTAPVWPGVDHAADRTTVLAGPWPRRPVARFGTKLTIGWPCWFVVVRCEADVGLR